MANGNMLQIIIFAMLFGYAISISGKAGRVFVRIFNDANTVLMKLIFIVLWFAPYGVFCLLAKLFSTEGFSVIYSLAGYFFTVLAALAIQWFVVYGCFIRLFANLNPFIFFKKMYTAMIFSFSTSSSSASIPVTLDTVENKLGVPNSVASFVIPLGATINMDGTAIMQGVATVFIAHAYNIDIGLIGYLTVILTATLASIGTAGVPGVGLITLTMVLKQVGLPVEGIALIIGIDRLLDMVRTAVNVSGDCMVSLLVSKSQKELNTNIYNKKINENTTTPEQYKTWHE
jgi:Na+/H+-dicarboxylate symporter